VFLSDVKTRWNSTYFMLDRLKMIGNLVTTDFVKQVGLENLTPSEWNDVLLLVEFLQPFYETTRSLEGQTYPSLSIAYPLIQLLMQKIQQFDVKDSQLMGFYKTDVLSEVTVRFQRLGDLGKLAMILDPRTKQMQLFSHKFQKECEMLLLVELEKETKANRLKADEEQRRKDQIQTKELQITPTISLPFPVTPVFKPPQSPKKTNNNF